MRKVKAIPEFKLQSVTEEATPNVIVDYPMKEFNFDESIGAEIQEPSSYSINNTRFMLF